MTPTEENKGVRMPIQHAVAWWCFVPRLMTPAAFVRSVAELGYQAIDLAPAEYWPLIRDHGLAISAVGGHQSIAEGLNRQANHERIERELAEQIRLAEQWHIPNLICFSGNRAGLSDSAGLEVCAEGLHRVAGMAEQAGVNLVVELLNSKVDHADYQCDRTAWGGAALPDGRLATGAPALRYLSYADHGGGYHSHDRAVSPMVCPLPYRGEPWPPRDRPIAGVVLPGHRSSHGSHRLSRLPCPGVHPSRRSG